MKKKCVYLFLMLGLLLGQNNATFAKNDPMSVNKNNAAKVTISDAKDKAVAPKDKTEVKQTKVKEEVVKNEEPQKPKKKVVIHKVKSGESLWAIAQQHLGDGNRWRELVESNKSEHPSLLKNPNLIYTGWDLKIELDEEETQNKVATDTTNIASGTTNVATDTKDPNKKDTDSKVNVTDNSTDSKDVKQNEIPKWTTEQKVNKLKECVKKCNDDLKRIGMRIADLNTYSIKFLIQNGYMTEEDWMAMNPPVGYTYRINEKGEVELVNSKNQPLSSREIKNLDNKLAKQEQKELKEKQKQEEKELKKKQKEEKKELKEKQKEEKKELKERQKQEEKELKEKQKNERTTSTSTSTSTSTNKKVDPNAQNIENWYLNNKTNTSTSTKTSTSTSTKTNTSTKTDGSVDGRHYTGLIVDPINPNRDNRDRRDDRRDRRDRRDNRNNRNTPASELGESLGNLFKVFEDTGREISNSAKELGNAVNETGKEIKREAEKTGKEIRDGFKQAGEDFKQAGEEIRDGFKQTGEEFEEGFERGRNGNYHRPHHGHSHHGGGGRY